MRFIHDSFRSLEQQESGEIRHLRCPSCARSFQSRQQLQHHETDCIHMRKRRADERYGMCSRPASVASHDYDTIAELPAIPIPGVPG